MGPRLVGAPRVYNGVRSDARGACTPDLDRLPGAFSSG
jgi:hypothetical protein